MGWALYKGAPVVESFSHKTKEELARRLPEKSCCGKAELAAIIHSLGSIHLRAGDRLILSIAGENASTIRKVLRLLKTYFDVNSRIIIEETQRLGHHRRYNLQLSGEEMVKRILIELGIMTRGCELEGGISPEIVRPGCCRSAFLRGAFLARGSITDPLKNDYHLEIVSENEDFAQGLTYLMNLCGFKSGFSRRKYFHIYLKEADAIGKFLTFIGAHTAFLHLEEVRVIKGMRAEVNRLVNCETANLEKTVRAALEQVEVLSRMENLVGFNSLPEKLREIAWLRLEHPEASLKELGELSHPKLSKSAINHRMRKLLKLAKNSLAGQENISPMRK